MVARQRRCLIRDTLLLIVLLGAALTVAVPSSNRTAIPVLVMTSALALSVALLVTLLVVAAESWFVRFVVLNGQLSTRRFRPDAIRAPVGRAARQRLARLAAAGQGNVVIFRGFHPFVGSGMLIDAWSFPVDISKGSRDAKTGKRQRPKPFDAAELHHYLTDELLGLGLPGLQVTDRLFVNGGDVWQDQRLLPDRHGLPVTTVPSSVVREMLLTADPVARGNLCAEVTGWHGQLVVTTFFRAVRLRGSLYVEGAAFALLPLRDQYHAVDTLVPCEAFEAAAAALGQAAKRSLPLLLASPVRVLRAVRAMTKASRTERRQRRFITNGWHFNYCATTSIREITAGQDTRRYFLDADADMFEKVIREMLIRGLLEFLDDHDVDIDQVAKIQQTINNGNIFNGTVNANNSQNAFNTGKVTSNANPSARTH